MWSVCLLEELLVFFQRVHMPFVRSVDAIRSETARIRGEVNELLDVTVPSLAQQLAELDTTAVYLGDHKLKLARQSYLTQKQDLVRARMCNAM